MTLDLFGGTDDGAPSQLPLAPGVVLLRGFATSWETALLAGLGEVAQWAPFRHMVTPGGLRMSVAMTNCGALGWVSERTGCRYDPIDPASGWRWPDMSASFRRLAALAVAQAGFDGFEPDACLVNRYAPGSKLSLHPGRDERDLTAPIVSVSLGLPATSLFAGLRRADEALRVPLQHGDVVVWGGPARLRYHGVLPLQPGSHLQAGEHRINLTFRKAG